MRRWGRGIKVLYCPRMRGSVILVGAALAVLSRPGLCGPPGGRPSSGAGEMPRVKVEWARPRQTIVGFGGTMGWIHPHPSQRKEVFDLLFTKLGVSLLRIRALGGEGDDEKCLEPANDNDDPLDFDWSKFPIKETEAKNAIIIKAARERGVKTIVAVTWSPPGWMKTTGRRKGGGNLRETLLSEYAELWTAYLLGMSKEFDIDVKAISIQNEPDLEYYYPTCGIEPDLYVRAMMAVESRLRKELLDVRVLGPDTCRIFNMPRYVKAMEAARASPGTPVLTHLYDLSIPYERVGEDPGRWRKARDFAKSVKRPLWLMETANYLSVGSEAGSYDEALIWAQKMHWALVAGNCEVVCFWSLFFDKRGEGLIYCARSEDKKYVVTPKYYTSMNYFRFVRPGMVRCVAGCEDPAVLVSAFREPLEKKKATEERKRTMVFVNPRNAMVRVRLMEKVGGPWSCYITTEKWQCRVMRPVESGWVLLHPRSVTTLTADITADGQVLEGGAALEAEDEQLE
jgi:O-glycosyl hydrolase